MPYLSRFPGGRFWDDLDVHGSAVAIVGADGTEVRYDDLAARARAWSERLGPTRRLAVLEIANSPEGIAAYLGALRGGHPVVLSGSASATATLVDRYDPDVVLRCLGSEVATEERRTGSGHGLHPALALLLSTSGSTGSPKLVRLSHRNLATNAAAIAEYLELTPIDRALTTLPLHYCYGLSVLHSHLAVGASVALHDGSVVDPCFWRRFTATGATNFAGVPFTFELLDRVGFARMDLPTLRFVTQAGGRLDPATVVRYAELGARQGWRFFVMYGQTEATARMAYLAPEQAVHEPASIGRPIPGGAFEIDAPDADGIGELVYRGPNVMLGYAEEPADLARGRTVDVLRTGDLAGRTASGGYRVVGRTARFVKIVGLRVDLERVERLLGDAGVRAVCTGDDDRLVVAVAGGADLATAEAVVRGAVDLPRGAVRTVAVDEVPRLPSGKPDYRAVVALAATTDTRSPSSVAAGAGAAATVRALYAEVLGVDGVEDGDTFVGLGGDSLSYVELAAAIEEELGPLPPGWHVQSVGEVAASCAPSADRPTATVASLPTDVVLRMLATVVVLGTHVRLFHVQGGAHLLLAVAGFNFARFALDGLGSPLRRFLPTARRIAIPTMACVLALLVVDPPSFGGWKLLLVHNYADGGRWRYWFVEALLMLGLVAAAAFAIPAFRRLERARPFGVAMSIVGVGLLVRLGVGTGAVPGAVLEPHNLVWLFAIGWAATRARTTRQRLAVTGAATLGLIGFFPGDLSRSGLVLAGCVALVWTVRIPVPRRLHVVVTSVAAASLYVYLLQFEVYPVLLGILPPVLVVPVTVAVGVGAAEVVAVLVSRGAGLVRRPRPGRAARTAEQPALA